ncbi:MAG TPA: HNH endonuclease signature motif containing protein [Mycobacterium sp.]|nr:HNH endonuclease signature motif containing protein [Mycobacterium sp.]
MFESGGGAAAVSIGRLTAAACAENRAAGARLAAIGELDAVRAREGAVDEHWAIDHTNAVAAEVSAALSVSAFVAHGFLHYARAMRDRLPRVGGLLEDGMIGYWTFTTIVLRTDLIDDPEVIATVDATLTARIGRWSSLTRGRLAGYVDKLVAKLDLDALRQRREFAAERAISIGDSTRGMSTISGWLLTTDAHALDARLTALAGTVCDDDPRTVAQRRADALGALATGAQRLACRCERGDCPAGGKSSPAPAVIYVIAEQATLDGAGETPGSLIEADALIPPELLAELATTARRRPLVHPGSTPPESGYVPSSALADFVRCRDLTCRFPGCDVPAMRCDIDHTIPHADGGATHASNLKCECRTH